MSSTDWDEIDRNLVARQGDLLAKMAKKNPNIENAQLYLVITADCDIARNKSGKYIFCLKVIPVSTYMKQCWPTKAIDTLLTNSTKEIIKKIKKYHSIKKSEKSTLANDSIVDWVNRLSPHDLCEELSVAKEEANSFIHEISTYKQMLSENKKGGRNSDKLEVLSKLKCIKSGDEHEKVYKQQIKKFSEMKCNDLPDDIFLLPNMPAPFRGGHVILLRKLIAVPISNVKDQTDCNLRSSCYNRVQKVGVTCNHAISHKFGNLYSRVGLPEEYEILQKRALEELNNSQK